MASAADCLGYNISPVSLYVKQCTELFYPLICFHLPLLEASGQFWLGGNLLSQYLLNISYILSVEDVVVSD